MILVKMHNLETHRSETIHIYPNGVSQEEVEVFIQFQTSQDHCSSHVYYQEQSDD